MPVFCLNHWKHTGFDIIVYHGPLKLLPFSSTVFNVWIVLFIRIMNKLYLLHWTSWPDFLPIKILLSQAEILGFSPLHKPSPVLQTVPFNVNQDFSSNKSNVLFNLSALLQSMLSYHTIKSFLFSCLGDMLV